MTPKPLPLERREPPSLHVHHRYLLAWAKATAAARPGARVLDFGCGPGIVVRAGRELGLDLQGADAFYEGADDRPALQAAGLLGSVVQEIRDGRLPYPDAHFDLIVSNQVLEHVADLDATLAELSRVLKPDGRLLCLFPSREVFREAHCGVPFLHWKSRDSDRVRSARRWHWLGFSHGKGSKSPEQWAKDAVEWMDRHVTYRPRAEILAAFDKRFEVASIEPHYLRYRFGALGACFGLPGLRGLGRIICRRLNGLVLVAAPRRAILPS